LSNEEKTNDYENFEKGIIYIKILKKGGGRREKGGGGNEIHAPCACRQKDKQRSTKHTHKTKGRVTRTPLKTRGELGCSGKVSSSCSTSGTHRINIVTQPVISHE
jgi:hypothetical protein